MKLIQTTELLPCLSLLRYQPDSNLCSLFQKQQLYSEYVVCGVQGLSNSFPQYCCGDSRHKRLVCFQLVRLKRLHKGIKKKHNNWISRLKKVLNISTVKVFLSGDYFAHCGYTCIRTINIFLGRDCFAHYGCTSLCVQCDYTFLICDRCNFSRHKSFH